MTSKSTIIDYIIPNSDEKILHLGAGYGDGDFIRAFSDTYQIPISELINDDFYIGVDVDESKIQKIKEQSGETENLVHSSLQEYLDTNDRSFDLVLLTGVFDEYLYGDSQYQYVLSVVNKCMDIAQLGVTFTINTELTQGFQYSILYLMAELESSYDKFAVRKIDQSNYIFEIFK